jgi:hypothetical protein
MNQGDRRGDISTYCVVGLRNIFGSYDLKVSYFSVKR